MNISFLREFIVLAKCLNYSVAANYLFIAQPALSRHIALIEEEVGFRLFDRNTRRVTLTKYGEIFLRDATNIISSYDKAIEEMRIVKNEFEDTLNIGFLNWTINNLIAPLTMEFKKLYPRIRLNFVSYEYYEITRALLLNEISIAVTQRLDFPHANELEFHDIYKDPLVAMLRKDHPFANRENVNLSELKNEKFLLHDEQLFPGYWKLIEKICMDSGFKPLTEGIIFQVQTAPLLVEAGNGICITPMHLKPFGNQNLAFVPINSENCYTIISAAYKKGDSNPVRTSFIKLIDTYIAKIKNQSKAF